MYHYRWHTSEKCSTDGIGSWTYWKDDWLQNGVSSLVIASQIGHLDVVKYLCEIGGKKLILLANDVSMVHGVNHCFECNKKSCEPCWYIMFILLKYAQIDRQICIFYYTVYYEKGYSVRQKEYPGILIPCSWHPLHIIKCTTLTVIIINSILY